MARDISKLQPDVLAGIDARGFLVAAPLAARLGLGFTMIRKQGKLPGDTISFEYDLEYGTDTIEILSDAVQSGQRVVILDDLLATGGTLSASIELVKKIGGNPVGAACLIELNFLNGRDKLGGLPFTSLISYDD
jgi:adenine phosphoribosyltransferase